MAHFIVEYSANLSAYIDKNQLVEAIHQAAVKAEIFRLAGIRVRLHPVEHYAIADGHDDNGFIHIHIRVGHGRDETMRRQAAKSVFDYVAEFLAPVFEAVPLALSLELNEIPPETNFKKGNIREYMAQRKPSTEAGRVNR